MAGKSHSDRIREMIERADAVLRTHKPNHPTVLGFPTLDPAAFTPWRTQTLVCLEAALGRGHNYAEDFRTSVTAGFPRAVQAGVGILKAALEDLEAGHLESRPDRDPIRNLERLCSRFHHVAKQLRDRHDNRPTLDVQNEYDVQDLMHALLKLHFDDVRGEEYTPSYAGKSSRLDFLLKPERVVLELKMTRPGLGAKELGSQLIEDIARYESHPDCGLLGCFVYDPLGLVANGRGFESDLGREDGPFPVKVFVRPH